MTTDQPSEIKFLKLEQVLENTQLGRSAWYELIKDGKAPPPCKIGRASRWVKSEVDAWYQALMQQRNMQPRPRG